MSRLRSRRRAAWAASLLWLACARVLAGGPLSHADEPAHVELEVGLGHESSSSPLVRVSEDGALVVVPGLARLSGQVQRAAVQASALWSLTPQWDLALMALADLRRSRQAPGLGLDLGLVDASVRRSDRGLTLGFGPSFTGIAVAGRAFRQTVAWHLDAVAIDDSGQTRSVRLEWARHRHPEGLDDLDADALALSGSRRWRLQNMGVEHVEIGAGWRRERNRRALPELDQRSLHLSAELGWPAWGLDWTVVLLRQRSRFAGSGDGGAAATPTARRDDFLALDLGAEWAWSEQLGVRLSLGDARNRARPAFYDNRHRRAELSVSAHW